MQLRVRVRQDVVVVAVVCNSRSSRGGSRRCSRSRRSRSGSLSCSRGGVSGSGSGSVSVRVAQSVVVVVLAVLAVVSTSYCDITATMTTSSIISRISSSGWHASRSCRRGIIIRSRRRSSGSRWPQWPHEQK